MVCLVMRKSSTGPANRVAMNGSVQRFVDPHDVTNAQDLSEVPPHAEPSSSVGPALDSRTYSVVGYHFGLLSRKPGFESWYVRHQCSGFGEAVGRVDQTIMRFLLV